MVANYRPCRHDRGSQRGREREARCTTKDLWNSGEYLVAQASATAEVRGYLTLTFTLPDGADHSVR